MAEAVKYAKNSTKKEYSDNSAFNDTNKTASQNEIVDDQSLEKRLKSLKSFVNNLEPKSEKEQSILPPHQHEITVHPTAPEITVPPIPEEIKTNSSSNNNAYYDMISEQARLKLENIHSSDDAFAQLNTQLNIMKKADENLTSASAPSPFIESTLMAIENENDNTSQLTIHRHPYETLNQTTVVDYNLEKIKQLNQLNYPRLAWNKISPSQNHTDSTGEVTDNVESTQNDFRMVSELLSKKNAQIDKELMRFFEVDQLCKDLECYYKCKQIQSENFDANLNDFIQTHSALSEFQFDTSVKSYRNHEFFELCKDYYEARQLVNKCVRYMLEFKWQFIANQMRTIWSFEKYTIESTGMCGDQQQCKHELTSEKAYLNKLEIDKLQTMFYELRFNLIKSGLVSSQFCSKLAKFKIESYLHDFLNKFKSKNEFISTKTGLKTNDMETVSSVNNELKILIDILIYFNRKQCKPSFKLFQKEMSKNSDLTQSENNVYYEIDDSIPVSPTTTQEASSKKNADNIKSTKSKSDQEIDEINSDEVEDESEQNDELFKSNIQEWFRVLCCLLLNQTELYRQNQLEKLNDSNFITNHQLFVSFSNLHFENIFFILQHLLRSPDSYPTKFSYLLQIPLIELTPNKLSLNTSQSDSLVNMYFDFYLKLLASFSYDIKYRRQFLFFNSKFSMSKSLSSEKGEIKAKKEECNWEIIDLDGDLETAESVLVEISEDDLIKLYYQIPFNSIFNFLWSYLNNQSTQASSNASQSNGESSSRVEFRVSYVAMKILSFLDCLSRLSIRALLIYNRLKYKNFCKLMGKTLKEAIKFAFLLKDSSLQLHFDHFVKRIFTTIIYSSRVKSIRWIILSQLSIGELCLRTKWLILSIMCGIDVFHQNFEHLFNETITTTISNENSDYKAKPKDYILQAVQNDLEALLSHQENVDTNNCHKLSDIELLSFMRTLHFLISFKKPSEKENIFVDEDEEELTDFMNCVVKVLFKIAYCYPSTREICHKEGNSLLFAVCSVNPKLLSTVLIEIDANLNVIGKRALFLTAELPFNLWLMSINCESDLLFLEKCLLFSPTNSILFRIAVNCLDNLNFNQDTTKLSNDCIRHWLSANKNSNNPVCRNLSDCLINKKELIDIGQIVKIKIAIILFELHTRLTIYNYFSKAIESSNLITPQLFLIDLNNESVSSPLMKLNITSKDELNTHYSRLAKDKRLNIVNWIWSMLHRLNLFIPIDQSQTIDYLEELSSIYASASISDKMLQYNNIATTKTGFFSKHQRYLQLFYKIYLSHQTEQHQLVEMSIIFPNQELSQSETSDSTSGSGLSGSTLPVLETILQPKCPLECYLRLVLSRSGHDLNYIFDHGLDLIQSILNTHKKQTQLQQIAYYLVFNWFENLIFKHSTIKLFESKESSSLANGIHQITEEHQTSLLSRFRLSKQLNIAKMSTLLLIMFNPNANANTASKIIDTYCAQIFKRLEFLIGLPSNPNPARRQQLEENFQNYLYLWLEILITSIKNWHKYKNVVKTIDFLIAYSFQCQTKNKEVSNFTHAPIEAINSKLLDEIMTYVKLDFGIEKGPNSNETNNVNQNQTTSSSQQTAVQNNWSFNWLTNSLSYVVTTTASHVNNTVGAALNVVNGGTNGGGSATGDFELNHHQFTYDKRLYKECPYVGFYLSLCEERLETELAIWTTFRSYLLGAGNSIISATLPDSSSDRSNINTNNSSTFIESCWRKTLASVNKIHSLNLNFTPQRLMLFKWCERAIELPNDHPLLILYWQKFFRIYLDKDYYSSFSFGNTNNQSSRSHFDLELAASSTADVGVFTKIKSPTFKLFTSTTQLNSLLKQMKKQLELTSEHYAYQCMDSNNNNNGNHNNRQPSAPVANYQFSEFVSKLYYALSLWIDETRLHDPELYLPALPAHYQPNLLAKIFSKQSDLWIQYVDLNRLNYHIGIIVNSPKEIPTQDLTSESKTSLKNEEINLFFKQSDRFIVNIPSSSQLNLTFCCPLKEKFGPSIENLLKINQNVNRAKPPKLNEAELLLNVCEHELRNIFKYNKEVINHTLNNMLKLDDKLTNKLLIHLWSNEVSEKYVQVPCSSLINPMHQCTRPAMVKFVYEIATKRDQYRQEIKENRLNHDKLISNLIENSKSNGNNNINNEINKFPHDEIIKSMVAMNQLVKRLLRIHHISQQNNDETGQPITDTTNQFLLSRLFYLLIDLYETQMHHPNDLLNNTTGAKYTTDQQFSDSVHSYMFDLINMIGTNFIQLNEVNISFQGSRKRNQQIILEKIIQKLTSTITIANEPANAQSSSSSSSRRNGILLNILTRNKLSLMELCAQYVEPNDLDLFNEFYTNILCSVTSILLNENVNYDPNLSDLILAQNSCDTLEMVNQKFSIIIELLSKFSFFNLNKLITSSNLKLSEGFLNDVCATFVETNLNFLMDLKFEFELGGNIDTENEENLKKRQIIKEKNLKLIVEKCIDNFVSILNINYPLYFDYMLKKCLEFSSKNAAFKYGSRHLKRFSIIFRQNELLTTIKPNKNIDEILLSRVKYEKTFEFLVEYFNFERNRFRAQKRSLYSHWCVSCRDLSDVLSSIFTIYIDRFTLKEMIADVEGEEDLKKIMKKFEKSYDNLWEILINVYLVWIEPSSFKEVTTQGLINVREVYENEIALVGARDSINFNSTLSPGAALLLMFDSFLFVFHTILERLNLFSNQIKQSQIIGMQMEQNAKNYALNKLFHFYYEQIACALNSSSSINDNTLECYHTCLSKYSSTWFGSGQFEPDYRSINIMSELCLAQNTLLVKHLAFDLVAYLDLNRISENYFRKSEIQPMQINDLLKCWLQLLTEFCLRDSIRESSKFDSMLRPVYNQAEVLQCWSMLSDTSYTEVVMQRFTMCADYRYAFASRGLDRGLLINILKASAEFYSMASYRNSLSCFSSAKRRCYLKALCELLLKPSVQTVKSDHDSFQNCILNLLTDIETFSISNEDETTNLKHQIQLLLDEFLTLISSSQNKLVSQIYTDMLEAWISSSRDSPILLHLINRLTRNFSLLTASNNNDKYCGLIELCIEIYFETNRTNEEKINSWLIIMDNIEFKLHNFDTQTTDVEQDFEFRCLQNSSYLLLNAYMNQRVAVFKANFNEASLDFFDALIKYTARILSVFLNVGTNTKNISRPIPLKEEKFILIINKLLELYLNVIKVSNSSLIENKIGEQLVQLATLLSYYGEDSLSNQNPLNDSQSIGSDLLSSIGLNILAKKSQFSVHFRFYCKCMAVCILKQIVLTRNETVDSSDATNTALFPNLNQIQSNSPTSSNKPWLYKIRMSSTDQFYNCNNDLLEKESNSSGHISSSLPNPSYLSPSKIGGGTSSSSSLVNVFNQKFKQTAYQFHLIFQNKTYSNPILIELANFVSKNLQNSIDAQNFCLPQVFVMSKHLSSHLFKEKYYLF